MPDHRVTIRLSPELYAQLEARGSHGQPLAAIVRDALAHYLVWQPEQPPTAEDTTTTLTAMAASIEELQRQVQHLTIRLDTLAADRLPTAATEQSRQPQARKRQSRQPEQSRQPQQPT